MFKKNNELLTNEYKRKLSRYLECDKSDIFLYWKGRVALYAILKAMGIKAGDEVILQAYTCVVVANAVIYLGATPVYVDIDEDTYNMNIDQVEKKITGKTKAIICQNTYGLSSNLEKLMDLTKKYKVYTVEDCTHGFGGHYNGKPNGSYCDASFFSTQWSKPFSTGIGGFSVIHNKGLKHLVQKMEAYKIKPTKKETMNLKALYFAREYAINGLTYWPMVKLYRLLSKNNLVVGSSSGGEISSPKMAEDFFKDMSACQINKGIQSLKSFTKLQTLRKTNGKAYSGFLLKNNKNYVKKSFFDNHIFLRYPLLVRDREAFKAAAIKDKIILGEWFDSPLYPVHENLEQWGLKPNEFPVSQRVCRSIVNLETDIKNVDNVIRFLDKNLDNII